MPNSHDNIPSILSKNLCGLCGLCGEYVTAITIQSTRASGDLRETAKRVEDSERTVYVCVVVVEMRGDAQASTPKCAVDAGVEQRLIDTLVLARVTVGEHNQRRASRSVRRAQNLVSVAIDAVDEARHQRLIVCRDTIDA